MPSISSYPPVSCDLPSAGQVFFFPLFSTTVHVFPPTLTARTFLSDVSLCQVEHPHALLREVAAISGIPASTSP